MKNKNELEKIAKENNISLIKLKYIYNKKISDYFFRDYNLIKKKSYGSFCVLKDNERALRVIKEGIKRGII